MFENIQIYTEKMFENTKLGVRRLFSITFESLTTIKGHVPKKIRALIVIQESDCFKLLISVICDNWQ